VLTIFATVIMLLLELGLFLIITLRRFLVVVIIKGDWGVVLEGGRERGLVVVGSYISARDFRVEFAPVDGASD